MSLKLNFYNEKCAALARSIMLKSDMLAIEVESLLDPTLEFLKTPRTNWKYYMNCSGIYHRSNEVMYVVSLDTRASIEFTKNVLDEHPLTKQLYSTYGVDYQRLLAKYPKNAALIHGILAGMSTEDVIALPDYYVISYNKNLVEPQEYDLIVNLSKRMNAFGLISGNHDTVLIEEAYATMHMYLISMQLTNQIKYLRAENVLTSRAHSFFVWSKINSKIPLEDLKRYLTTPEIMYLYKNIDRLHRGRGSDAVFNEIIDKFIVSRNLKPYQLTIELDSATLNDVDFEREYVFRENPLRAGTSRLQSKDVYIEEHVRRSRYKKENYSEELSNKLTYKHDINDVAEVRIVSEEATEAELRNLLINVDFNFQFLKEGLIKDIFNIPNHITGDIYQLSYAEALALFVRLTQILGGEQSECIPLYDTMQVPVTNKRPTENELVSDWSIPPHLARIMFNLIPAYPIGEPNRLTLNKYIDDFSSGILQFRRLMVQSTTRNNETYIDRLLGKYLKVDTIKLIGDGDVNYNDWLISKGISLSNLSIVDIEIIRKRILTDVMGIALGEENELVTVMSDLLSRFIAYRTNLSRESIPSSSLTYTVFPPTIRGVRGSEQTTKHSIPIHLETNKSEVGNLELTLDMNVIRPRGVTYELNLNCKGLFGSNKPIVQSPMELRTNISPITKQENNHV